VFPFVGAGGAHSRALLEIVASEEIALPMNRLADGWFQRETPVGLAGPGHFTAIV